MVILKLEKVKKVVENGVLNTKEVLIVKDQKGFLKSNIVNTEEENQESK